MSVTMAADTRPWGPVALVLAGCGAAVAPFVSVRWPTISFAAAGLFVALLGMPGIIANRSARNGAWLVAGLAVTGGILGVSVLAPTLLHPRQIIDEQSPVDPNQMVRVPIEEPLHEGSVLTLEESVEAANDGIRQNDLFVRVKSVKTGKLPGNDGTSRLLIHIFLFQPRPGRTITFQGFARDEHTPALTDAAQRSYAFVGHYSQRFSAAFDLVQLHLDHTLVFELPGDAALPLQVSVPASAWGQRGMCRFVIRGIDHEPAPDLIAEIARYKKLLRAPAKTPPDAMLGRALFVRHCQECHTLYGVGGKTGPDLTPVKRHDLDFLITSVVNPSAEIAKGFEPWVIVTTSGRIISGIIKEKTQDALHVQTSGPKVVVPHSEIEDQQQSKVSIMPTELLKPFDEHEVRSLFTYLSGTVQTPILARPETVVIFGSHGQDLNSWQRARGKWTVERDEIVSVAQAAAAPSLLRSELALASDFRVSLRFHPGKDGHAALALAGVDGKAPGPRVNLVAGQNVTLVSGSEANKDVQDGSGAAARVKADDWNQLEIAVIGQRLEVRLNGVKAGALSVAGIPERCAVVLEAAARAGQAIRFSHLDLQMNEEAPR